MRCLCVHVGGPPPLLRAQPRALRPQCLSCSGLCFLVSLVPVSGPLGSRSVGQDPVGMTRNACSALFTSLPRSAKLGAKPSPSCLRLLGPDARHGTPRSRRPVCSPSHQLPVTAAAEAPVWRFFLVWFVHASHGEGIAVVTDRRPRPCVRWRPREVLLGEALVGVSASAVTGSEHTCNTGLPKTVGHVKTWPPLSSTSSTLSSTFQLEPFSFFKGKQHCEALTVGRHIPRPSPLLPSNPLLTSAWII